MTLHTIFIWAAVALLLGLITINKQSPWWWRLVTGAGAAAASVYVLAAIVSMFTIGHLLSPQELMSTAVSKLLEQALPDPSSTLKP